MKREYILNTPLPLSRNFQALKQHGIEKLQRLVGNEWTDFNESDPGITILEQLCYALTELGYIQHFPIEDILTQADGNIAMKNQFFTPSEILTSTPVTLLDYRKWLLDQLPALRNVYVTTHTDTVQEENTKTTYKTGGLQIYLLPKEETLDGNKAKALEQEAWQLLSQCRNLGQWFLQPLILTPVPFSITGTVTVEESTTVAEAHSRIKMALDDYVSPIVHHCGYKELRKRGQSSDQIFNGPLLTRGWIPDNALAEHRSTVKTNDIAYLLKSVKGVEKVEQITLSKASTEGATPGEAQWTIDETQVVSFDISRLVLRTSRATSKRMEVEKQVEHELQMFLKKQPPSQVGAVEMAPPLPTGRNRHISAYESIQNTFPLAYGIGVESVPAGSSAFRIAQARQLKGYLMVFDQLIANQLAQLAMVSHLFGFRGTPTLAETPGESYTGIPYQLFSPTYYSQPLYEVPEVKPLLVGNDMYRYSLQPITATEEEEIWKRYKENPFNQYMSGLRRIMEDDDERDDRRSRMLNHLLSRHGQDPDWIDSIVQRVRWYGSIEKTRIIVKSLMLQNYQAFSYYHPKAYNNLFAEKIGTVGRYRLTRAGFQHLAAFGLSSLALNPYVNVGYKSKKRLLHAIKDDPTIKEHMQSWDEARQERFFIECIHIEDAVELSPIRATERWSDGQLNLERLAQETHFRAIDFVNFAAVEMQLNLLLGLEQHYQLLTQLLANLLLSNHFKHWNEESTFYLDQYPDDKAPQDLDIRVAYEESEDAAHYVLSLGTAQMLLLPAASQAQKERRRQRERHNLFESVFVQLTWLSQERQGALLLEPLLWLKKVNAQQPGALIEADLPAPLKEHDLYFKTYYLLPEYVCLFREEGFLRRLFEVIKTYWPIPLKNQVSLCSYNELQDIISHFTTWQNEQYLSAYHIPPLSEEPPESDNKVLYDLAQEVLTLAPVIEAPLAAPVIGEKN